MSKQDSTSARGFSARQQTKCADCGRPLTERERFIGDTCIECEREYQLDTHSDDDYPRAA